MARWTVRQTLVLLLVAQGASAALLDTGYAPIYRENFIGETTFPTTPETDAYGVGGLELLDIVPGTNSTLTLNPAGWFDLKIGLFGLEGLTRGDDVVPTLPGQFGVRGVFSGFEFGQLESQAGVIFQTTQDPSPGIGLTAAVFMEDGVVPVLAISQVIPARVSFREVGVDLPPAMSQAILDGDVFWIDLVVDLSTAEATASLSTDGMELQTPVIDIGALTLGDIRGLGQMSWNYAMCCGGTDHRVTVHQLEGFVPLPEPSGGLGFGACAVVGLAHWRRRAMDAKHRAHAPRARG
ncbi:MAG: hypothetical protein AAF430_23605 [Myxococcota bacterium]